MLLPQWTHKSTSHTSGRSPSCIPSPSTPFIYTHLSRFSINISACSPTLYDTSTYEMPVDRNGGYCILYASSLCWKTWPSSLLPASSLQALITPFQWLQSPLLQGKLLVVQVHSRELFEGLVALPGGLNFHSLELHQCKYLEVIFAVCGQTTALILYLWLHGGVNSEPNSSIYVYIMI